MSTSGVGIEATDSNAPAIATPLRGRSGPTLNGTRRATIAILLLPFVALFLAFYIAPALYALYESLFGITRSGELYGAPQRTFVGLANYWAVLTDSVFQASVVHILAYGFGPTILLIAVAIVLALVIDARKPGPLTAFFRLSTFAPYAVPGVVAAILWGFLYSPTTSPVMSSLKAIGISFDPLSGGLQLWGIGNIGIWTYMGYNILLFLAQLHTVDPALYEAARLDGAGPLNIALRIKLPLMRPAIILSVIFNIIGTIQIFTEPQTLQTISGSITSTWTPTMMAYQEAASNNYGYSATIAIIIAVVAGACSFLVLRSTRALAA